MGFHSNLKQSHTKIYSSGTPFASTADKLPARRKMVAMIPHFSPRDGKFKVDMLAGRTVTELMKSGEERVRLDAAKY
jgi:hypothetical protein